MQTCHRSERSTTSRPNFTWAWTSPRRRVPPTHWQQKRTFPVREQHGLLSSPTLSQTLGTSLESRCLVSKTQHCSKSQRTRTYLNSFPSSRYLLFPSFALYGYEPAHELFQWNSANITFARRTPSTTHATELRIYLSWSILHLKILSSSQISRAADQRLSTQHREGAINASICSITCIGKNASHASNNDTYIATYSM